MTGIDNILADLRAECLSDPDVIFDTLRESLAQLSANPQAALQGLLKSLHSLKGNVQAVGFEFLAKFVHALESEIQNLLDRWQAAPIHNLDEAERCLSLAFGALESYFAELRRGDDDSESKLQSRQTIIGDLSQVGEAAPIQQVELLPAAGFGFFAEETQANTASEPGSAPSGETPPLTADDNAAFGFFDSAPVLAQPAEAPSVSPAKPIPQISAPSRQEKVQPPVLAPQAPEKDELYMVFLQHGQRYALPLVQVDEVIDALHIQKFPFPRREIAGLVIFRGDTLTILDSSAFGVPCPASEGRLSIIVTKLREIIFGILVEAVEGILVVKTAKIQSLTQGGEGSWVQGILKEAGERIVILAIHNLRHDQDGQMEKAA